MSKRYPGGFVSNTYYPLLVPDAPTVGTATAGVESATVTFTAPENPGGAPITSYVISSQPGGFSATGSGSPITITDIPGSIPTTFTVWAINKFGPSPGSSITNTVTPTTLARAVFAGGTTDELSSVDNISVVLISTTGNATNFGDLSLSVWGAAGCGSITRGIISGGYNTVNRSNTIQYITFGSTGNATDFGDMIYLRGKHASCNSSTRGLFMGWGVDREAMRLNNIDYVTIASTGNSLDFGNIGYGVEQLTACSSPTRAVTAGGTVGEQFNSAWQFMDYVTIATLGNMQSFGRLTQGVRSPASFSSGTRGVIGGGVTGVGDLVNIMEYITIATTGNSEDFGDLTVARTKLSGASSSTRGLFAGGNTSTPTNIIDYVTIASTGNATDFGDLISTEYVSASCSNNNGGVQ